MELVVPVNKFLQFYSGLTKQLGSGINRPMQNALRTTSKLYMEIFRVSALIVSAKENCIIILYLYTVDFTTACMMIG